MNLVLLKVSAYNPQASAQQAQPRPSVLISGGAAAPGPDGPNRAGSCRQWGCCPPLRRAQVPARRAPRLQPLSQALPYVCSPAGSPSAPLSPPDPLRPPTPAPPGRRFPAAAFCHFLTVAEFAQRFPGLKPNRFCCVLQVIGKKRRTGNCCSFAGTRRDRFVRLLPRGGRGRSRGGSVP